MGCAKVLLVMFMIGFEKGICVNWNPVPRKTVKYNGEYLMTKQNCERFLPAVTWQQMSPLSCSRFSHSIFMALLFSLFVCLFLLFLSRPLPSFSMQIWVEVWFLLWIYWDITLLHVFIGFCGKELTFLFICTRSICACSPFLTLFSMPLLSTSLFLLCFLWREFIKNQLCLLRVLFRKKISFSLSVFLSFPGKASKHL